MNTSAYVRRLADMSDQPLQCGSRGVPRARAGGMKREAGAWCEALQDRRCPRNGKRVNERRMPLCLHGKALFGAGGSYVCCSSARRPAWTISGGSRWARLNRVLWRPQFVCAAPARCSVFPCRQLPAHRTCGPYAGVRLGNDIEKDFTGSLVVELHDGRPCGRPGRCRR